MDRQIEALRLSESLLEDIELQRLKASEVVLKASRLARLVGHDDLQEFLAFERNGYAGSGWAKWAESAGRRIPPKKNDGGDPKYRVDPLAAIESTVTSSQQAIDALHGGGNYSGEMAFVSSRDHDNRIASHALLVSRGTSICKQVISTVYELLVEIYHELLFSELQATLFAQAQAQVDGILAEAGGSALGKIEKVSTRLREGDPESVSHALTTCRRLIVAVADHLFPATDGVYDVGGQSLKVGDQNVLNRLQAYVHSTDVSKARRDRIRRGISDLFDRCSAGTHADVSVQEARFVFLQAYVLLGEVLTLTGDNRKVV